MRPSENYISFVYICIQTYMSEQDLSMYMKNVILVSSHNYFNEERKSVK